MGLKGPTSECGCVGRPFQIQTAGRGRGILPLLSLNHHCQEQTFTRTPQVIAFKLLQIYCFRGTKSQKAIVNSQCDREIVGTHIILFLPDLYTHISHHLNPTKESHRFKDRVQIYEGPSRPGLAYPSGLTLYH